MLAFTLHTIKSFSLFWHYQRSCWRTRPNGRTLRRTWGPLLSLWGHASLSPPVCRPSQSQRTSQTSGAQRCRPSPRESSKQGWLLSGPRVWMTPHLSCIHKLCIFFFWIHVKNFFSLFRTSRFASFPEYLIVQIKKFTFGVDWVPKKLGNCHLHWFKCFYRPPLIWWLSYFKYL